MLRIPCRLNVSSRKKVASLWKDQRLRQSTESSSSKSSKKGIIALCGVTTLAAGGVGYASWSYENRKLVQDNIPGSNYLLEPLLGPLQEHPKPKLPQKPEPGLLQKKLEREKAKEKESLSKPSQSSAPAPPITAPAPAKDAKKDAKVEKKDQGLIDAKVEKKDQGLIEVKETTAKPGSSSDIEKRLASSEKTENAENEALSQRLDQSIKDAQKFVTSALSASEEATKAVRRHAEKAFAAIDSGEGHASLYAVAAEVAKAKTDLVKIAEEKLDVAKEKIKKLQDEVTSARASKLTKGNVALSAAEETLAELNYAVTKINSSVAEALRDSTSVSEFRDLVEASRTQFEAEVRSLLPDVKIGEKSDKLTTDELNLLLAHAHRKVLALQKSLAKQQTVDKERFKDSVLRQREMETKLLDGKLHSELERQRRDLGLEHRHRLQQLREDLETELRSQLKRQAAAHSDHLADMLNMQEKQLVNKWESKLKDELQNESDMYYKSLSKIQGDLNGLKVALKSRADADKAAHSAHELWLACESLKSALRLGKENSRSWEEQLLPLEPQMESIKKAAGDRDAFVTLVLSTIPPEALKRGVYTEDALRERFLKVDRVCKRVALIGDNGGSLIRYLLSYVQSFFLVSAFDRMPGTELRDEEIDVEKLDTHDILARVRYCIAKDDLVQAIKYLNLLRGEPRNVASDWLKEARLSLEAKQAADCLMAHAAATGAKAL